MKKLFVYYNGWGERWLLGTLADNGENLAPCGRTFRPQHIPLFLGYNWDNQEQA